MDNALYVGLVAPDDPAPGARHRRQQHRQRRTPPASRSRQLMAHGTRPRPPLDARRSPVAREVRAGRRRGARLRPGRPDPDAAAPSTWPSRARASSRSRRPAASATPATAASRMDARTASWSPRTGAPVLGRGRRRDHHRSAERARSTIGQERHGQPGQPSMLGKRRRRRASPTWRRSARTATTSIATPPTTPPRPAAERRVHQGMLEGSNVQADRADHPA